MSINNYYNYHILYIDNIKRERRSYFVELLCAFIRGMIEC